MPMLVVSLNPHTVSQGLGGGYSLGRNGPACQDPLQLATASQLVVG